MATNTTNYNFFKPTVSGDSGVWGGYLNDNWESTDQLLGGESPITGIDINSGTIDGAVIGGAAAGAGSFTTLSASTSFTLGGTAITATGVELNYVDGVTSAIQTQLDAKLATPGSTTGSGALVYGTSPTLVTPVLGTPASGNLSSCTVDGTEEVGFRNVPAVGTKTTAYTLTTADVGKYVQVGTSGSIVIPNSTFAEGDAISIFNNTTGDVTITCSITTAYISGTNTDEASVALATRGVCTILFISGTICVISGAV